MEKSIPANTIYLQLGINRRLYQSKKISLDTYTKANDALLSRLMKLEHCGTIKPAGNQKTME